MQKDDRGSLTLFLIGHFQPFNGDVFHRSEMSRVNGFSIFSSELSKTDVEGFDLSSQVALIQGELTLAQIFFSSFQL